MTLRTFRSMSFSKGLYFLKQNESTNRNLWQAVSTGVGEQFLSFWDKNKRLWLFFYFLSELTNWASQNQRKIQPCGTVIIFFTFQSHGEKFSDIFIVPAEINAVTVTTFSICTTNFKYFFYGKFRIEWTLFPFEPFCTWSSTNCWIWVVFFCTS